MAGSFGRVCLPLLLTSGPGFADTAGGLNDRRAVQGQPLCRPGLAGLPGVDALGGPEPRQGGGENHGQEIGRLHLPGEVTTLLRVGHFGHAGRIFPLPGLVPVRP